MCIRDRSVYLCGNGVCSVWWYVYILRAHVYVRMCAGVSARGQVDSSDGDGVEVGNRKVDSPSPNYDDIEGDIYFGGVQLRIF